MLIGETNISHQRVCKLLCVLLHLCCLNLTAIDMAVTPCPYLCLHCREQYRFARSEATVVDQKVRLIGFWSHDLLLLCVTLPKSW